MTIVNLTSRPAVGVSSGREVIGPRASRRRRRRALRPMAEGLEERALLAVGLDPTYGFGGLALLNIPPNSATVQNGERLSSIANQSGKVVAVGTLGTETFPGPTVTRTLAVTRFNADGSIDTSFGTNGTTTIPISSGGVTFDGDGSNIAVQADGEIDVIGTASTSGATTEDIVVARLNADGSIDRGFGTSGFRLVPFMSSTATPLASIGSALNVGPDGKMVAVGFVETGGPGGADFAIARLNTDGSLDTSLGGTGMTTVAFDLGGATGLNDDSASDVVVQPDDKIVVVGSAQIPPSAGSTATLSDAAVARLNSNGTLDTSFNGTGKVTYSYNLGGSGSDTATAVALRGTQIVIAGTSTQEFPGGTSGLNNQALAVTRLNSNGSFDQSFNGSGKFLLTLTRGGINFNSQSSAILVLPDNSLLIGATALETNTFNQPGGLLVKLTSGGALDAGFGSGGAAILPIALRGRMIIQTDGKIAYGNVNGVARTTGPAPAPTPAPAVVGTTILTTGTGRRTRAVGIKIRFNTALNEALASNSRIYTILPAKGRRAIALRKRGAASYDPASQTLTLLFNSNTSVGSGFRVLIAPGAIVGADRQVLADNTILVPVTAVGAMVRTRR
jgi:uncharacterized delta-60 repeat protein